MVPGQRIDAWVERAQAQLAAFDDELPIGLAVEEVFEQASYTNQRLSDVAISLLMGLAPPGSSSGRLPWRSWWRWSALI